MKSVNMYKVNSKDLFGSAMLIRAKSLLVIKPLMVELFREVIFNRASVVEKHPNYAAKLKLFPIQLEAKYNLVYEEIINAYKKQNKTLWDSLYNFDVTVGFWQFEDNFYMKTITSKKFDGLFSFLEEMKEVEEFNFDSDAEKPKGVTKKAWGERERILKDLTENRWYDNIKLQVTSVTNIEEFFPFIDDVFTDAEIATFAKELVNA